MVKGSFRIGRHDVPESPWISPRVEHRPSPGKGHGLFAVEPIPAGEVVLAWGGESYTDADGAAEARAEGLGTMQWDEDLFSRETPELPVAFAINHACDPDVWMRDTFTLTARRDIASGEELTLDYAMIPSEPGDRADWECRCGSPFCRGRITGNDWEREDLRIRYAGHFCPWLNRRMEPADER